MSRAKAIPEIITIHVPFRIVKRGGRKEMIMPPNAQTRRQADDSLIKALARAFRWKRMLDSGEFSTITELAQRERIAAPFLTRTMRLAQLAPDLVGDSGRPTATRAHAGIVAHSFATRLVGATGLSAGFQRSPPRIGVSPSTSPRRSPTADRHETPAK